MLCIHYKTMEYKHQNFKSDTQKSQANQIKSKSIVCWAFTFNSTFYFA